MICFLYINTKYLSLTLIVKKTLFIGRYCQNKISEGPEKVAKKIFSLFTEENNTCFIEYFFDGNKYGYCKKLFGKEIITFVNNSPVFRLGLFRILFYILSYKPDIIHIINFERFAVIAYLYKTFSNVKIYYSMHGLICYTYSNFEHVGYFQKKKDSICEKIFFKKSDIIFVLSDLMKKSIIEKFKAKSDDIIIVPNGVEKEFNDIKKPERTYDILKIIFVSDINRKEKEFNFLLEILENITIGIELSIVSRNIKIIRLDNDKIVYKFHKTMTSVELANFYMDKDVIISCSSYEPFSMVTVEGMASGLVPVATYQTGASEYIRHGENGFLFDFGDKKTFIKIIEMLGKDKEAVHKLSNNAREIYKILSWENVFIIYKNYYL